MALSNPLYLFAEFELLNGFPLNTGGEWTIISSPIFPIDICTDCGGGFSDVTYIMSGHPVCAGVHDPVLDMTGILGSCLAGVVEEGEYVFKYTIAGGSCPSESFFTVNVEVRGC